MVWPQTPPLNIKSPFHAFFFFSDLLYTCYFFLYRSLKSGSYSWDFRSLALWSDAPPRGRWSHCMMVNLVLFYVCHYGGFWFAVFCGFGFPTIEFCVKVRYRKLCSISVTSAWAFSYPPSLLWFIVLVEPWQSRYYDSNLHFSPQVDCFE